MSRSLLRIFAALAAALLLLGACGGDDEGAESPSAETSEPDDDGTTTTADDEADDTTTTEGGGAAEDTGDDDADDTGNDVTTTTAESADLDSADLPEPATIDDFCGVFEVFNAIEDPYVVAEQAPDAEARAAAFRYAFTMAAALFERGAELAPDEVAADMAVVADGFVGLTDIMAEYDWDETALQQASEVDPQIEERLRAIDSEEFAAAEENVEALVLADCGIELS